MNYFAMYSSSTEVLFVSFNQNADRVLIAVTKDCPLSQTTSIFGSSAEPTHQRSLRDFVNCWDSLVEQGEQIETQGPCLSIQTPNKLYEILP